MKPMQFLPPVAALITSAAWLGARQHTVVTLEKETELIRSHVEAARMPAGGEVSLAELQRSAKEKTKEDEADWEGIAKSLAGMQQGQMPDMRVMMDLQTRLMGMTGEQLVAALDEIAGLELSKTARQALEGMVVGMLAQKEPKLALDRFIKMNGSQDNPMGGWQLANAFQQWSAKDRGAAVAWFDERIAAGDFESKSLDGKNETRQQLEAAVIASLMKDDPDVAAKRLAALSVEERKELFQQGAFFQVKPGNEKAFANLVREALPEDERGEALGRAGSSLLHQGGYEKVSGFLDEIEATPAERTAVAKQTATGKLQQLVHQSGVDREAVDGMREWLATQAPDEVDAITGETLGNLWSPKSDWKDRAAIVTELHGEAGNDDLLVSFLNGHRSRDSANAEAAREMASRISDEGKRAEVLQQLGGSGVPVAPTSND